MYLSVDEVAVVTGFSRTTVLNAIYSGELTAFKIHERWKVPEEAVQSWIEGDDDDGGGDEGVGEELEEESGELPEEKEEEEEEED